MGWIETSGGYAVTLEGTRVRCRNAAGRMLRQVPAKLRDDAEVVRLRQLAEWLERHDRECREQVDGWLVRSLPVPAALIVQVWQDASWQAALRDLVVAPVGADGSADMSRAGFLRDAADGRGLGVVDLDGDSARITDERVLLPHPVLLEDLAELREFAAELGVEQGIEQLMREVWLRPEDADATSRSYEAYAGAEFEQLQHATSRATALGYRVRGGSASCRLFEDGRRLDAAYWIGDEYPEVEAYTGGLSWSDPAGRAVPLGEVGPVAWSEGVRMAAAIHAGRVVSGEDEDTAGVLR